MVCLSGVHNIRRMEQILPSGDVFSRLAPTRHLIRQCWRMLMSWPGMLVSVNRCVCVCVEYFIVQSIVKHEYSVDCHFEQNINICSL